MTYPEHVSTEILADHAEGLLGESESGRVAGHLAECEDCRATALLLASIPAILGADEVGPMPAVYASRIDAAIADLLVSEPPVPLGEPVAAATPIAVSPIGHDPATNNVVDLNSRRKVALAGLRRVSTVAAGMVLLIAGAALGIQTVGKDKVVVGPTGESEIALPEITSLASPYYSRLKPPKTVKPGPRKGTTVDPETGTMYSKDRVRFSDGTVVTLDSKGRPAGLIKPAPRPAQQSTPDSQQPAQEPEAKQPSKAGDKTAITGDKGNRPAPGTERGEGATTDTPTGDPAALGAQEQPPATKPDDKPITAQKVQTGAQASDDPYVSESGSEYNEDNFAALVMDLVAAAERHSEGSSSFEPSSTSPTPTPSMKMPSGFRMPSSWASFFAAQQMPQQPGRGPAEARFQNRVERCAAQLKTKAIAGDIGTWQGKQATIVVVPSPNESQVDGYVFYGGCPNDKPVTAESAQWTQRVDRPAPDSSEPTPTPVRRTGSIQPAAMDNASRYRSR